VVGNTEIAQLINAGNCHFPALVNWGARWHVRSKLRRIEGRNFTQFIISTFFIFVEIMNWPVVGYFEKRNAR
jgi:hypothetical protein